MFQPYRSPILLASMVVLLSTGLDAHANGTAGLVTVDVQVDRSDDDAEQRPDGNMRRSSSDLDFVRSSGENQQVGMRFRNLDIPQGAEITSATIEFEAASSDDRSTWLLFQGEDVDDARSFSNDDHDISRRIRTSAYRYWTSIPAWSEGAKYQTPDLSTIVQEIVDRPGWEPGNELAILVSGSGKRAADSYDGDANDAPRLKVTYRTPTPSGSVRFAVIGDFGESGQPEADVANLVASWNPDLVITVGDNYYRDDADVDDFDEHLGQYYSNFIFPYIGDEGPGSGANRFFPTLGNHDWDTSLRCSDSDDCDGIYMDYFSALPGNGRYYDFVAGPVHFFAYDSCEDEEPDGVEVGSTQAQWLQTRLAASTAQYKVVYMHHPPYSSGDHGNADEVQLPFKQWGADIVLAGHDHNYERLVVDGFPYIVNGLGGKSIREFRAGDEVSGSQVRFKDDYGAMLVSADSNGITFEFYTVEDELIDSFELPLTSTTQSIRIAHDDDDAEEESDGNMLRSSGDLDIVRNGSEEQIVGLRFQGLQVPQGAVISRATLEFVTDEEDDGSTDLLLYAHDIDHAPSFSNNDFDISSRPLTSSWVSWDVPEWEFDGDNNTLQQTPDLSALIQEVVDRPGWQAGNAVALVITGSGRRVAVSHEGDSSEAPLLSVEYEVPSSTSPASTVTGAYGGHTYEVRTAPLDRLSAQSDCASDGMQLVKIENPGENDYLQSLVASMSEPVWIGAHASFSHWYWADSSVLFYDFDGWIFPIQYANFAPGEPYDPANRDYSIECSTLSPDGEWFGSICGLERNYICESSP